MADGSLGNGDTLNDIYCDAPEDSEDEVRTLDPPICERQAEDRQILRDRSPSGLEERSRSSTLLKSPFNQFMSPIVGLGSGTRLPFNIAANARTLIGIHRLTGQHRLDRRPQTMTIYRLIIPRSAIIKLPSID